MPSTIATSPGPCDSPAVVKRNVVIARKAIGARRSAARRPHHVERRLAAGPDLQRERALLDEDLEPVDDGRRRPPRRPRSRRLRRSP